MVVTRMGMRSERYEQKREEKKREEKREVLDGDSMVTYRVLE